MIPSRVFEGAPAAGGSVDALVVMVSKQLAAGALSEGVEAEAAFSSEGGGEGRESLVNKEGSLGSGDGDDDGGGSLASTRFIRGEPSGLLGKGKTSVERCELRRDGG